MFSFLLSSPEAGGPHGALKQVEVAADMTFLVILLPVK